MMSSWLNHSSARNKRNKKALGWHPSCVQNRQTASALDYSPLSKCLRTISCCLEKREFVGTQRSSAFQICPLGLCGFIGSLIAPAIDVRSSSSDHRGHQHFRYHSARGTHIIGVSAKEVRTLLERRWNAGISGPTYGRKRSGWRFVLSFITTALWQEIIAYGVWAYLRRASRCTK